MSDTPKEAFQLLSGKPSRLGYLIYKDGIVSEKPILEEEMPEFIPCQNDLVHFEENRYIVTARHFFPMDNEIIVLIQPEEEYMNSLLSMKPSK